ncbi:MAG: hypothetical protein GMKNLPBB_01737 [Myxococcota bacterium]|nr:hypothetical protein [Myxococcota bacterium]
MKPISPRISAEAVKTKTGRDWKAWFALLQKAGAADWPHPAIAAWLGKTHKVDDWWSQMIAVEYEKSTGRRKRNQKPDGYEISVSRTLTAGAGAVYNFLTDGERRGLWLKPHQFTVTTSAANKRIRGAWNAAGGTVEMRLAGKTGGKTQITVQHMKIQEEQGIESLRAYWRDRLVELAQAME